MGQHIVEAKDRFRKAMSDDFNTPQAIAALFDLIRNMNPLLSASLLSKEAIDEIKKFFKEVDSILGIVPTEQKEIPANVRELIEEREKLREEKKYEAADNIRAQIQSLGYEVEDTVYGPLVIYKSDS